MRIPEQKLGTRFRRFRNAGLSSGTFTSVIEVESSRHELLALDLLRAELGGFTDVQRVDGHNPAHPGQTFDFAVRTTDDERWRAIEVTMAADEAEIATRAAIDRLCLRLERLIHKRSPHERSSFVLSGVIESRVRVNCSAARSCRTSCRAFALEREVVSSQWLSGYVVSQFFGWSSSHSATDTHSGHTWRHAESLQVQT